MAWEPFSWRCLSVVTRCTRSSFSSLLVKRSQVLELALLDSILKLAVIRVACASFPIQFLPFSQSLQDFAIAEFIAKSSKLHVSRYEQWDGSPVQTRNRNPRQNSGSQQQFFKHSRNRKKKQKNKRTKKKKNGQGEMSEEKKEIKYSSKEILIRLYFIRFSSRLSQCCF